MLARAGTPEKGVSYRGAGFGLNEASDELADPMAAGR
jgi:hypothetical protein